MKNKLLLLLKVIAFPFAVIMQIITALILLPSVVIRNKHNKGTTREFNSGKKELLFGKNIEKKMSMLKRKDFPVKLEKDGKYSKYTVDGK